MDAVSGASQASAYQPPRTEYERLRRLEQLDREHIRLMRGWSHLHNTAYAVAQGFDYSPQYGCYMRGRR